MNEQGKICPICNKDIGIWTVIKTPLPNMMRCKNCKSKITYEKKGYLIIFISSLVYVALLVATFHLFNVLDRFSLVQSVVIWAIICILYWQPFEVIIAIYLRRTQKLIINS